MIDYFIKGKLRFNDPLTFNDSHILYDCVEKLEQIEKIVDAWNNDASHSFEDMCKINGIIKGAKLCTN